MLSDRDYMNRGGGRRPRQVNYEENPNMCVYILIAINALVFFTVPPGLDLYRRLALSSMGIKAGMYWQIVSTMFMHGGFMHILFNMWGLYLFGTLIAPHLRTVRFLVLYFLSGICGSLLWLAFNWNSPAYVVGASGALFGILIATAMLEPDRQFIILLFPVPMKAKTLVAIYAVVEILSVQGSSGNVAHLAHVGGLIGGYLYIRLFCSDLIAWEPLGFLFPHQKSRSRSGRGSWTINTPPLYFTGKTEFDFDRHLRDPDAAVTQKELDYLLDKVSREGINSLSEAEMATLRKAREQMRQR
ncbi:MAG: rhomboid family intramembrane serine protease [Victivallaceae bacterium]|nr:rhomboid family intramembrane serine protease [Victivallaceae bacterium]